MNLIENQMKFISSGGENRNKIAMLNNDLPVSNGEISLGATNAG